MGTLNYVNTIKAFTIKKSPGKKKTLTIRENLTENSINT